MMTAFDPRVTPARPDLAAKHLEGQVEAERFVDGVLREVVEAQAPLRRTRRARCAARHRGAARRARDDLRRRRRGVVLGPARGRRLCRVVCRSRRSRAPGPEPTHRVAALRTFVFPGPSIKLPPLMALSLGSRIAVARVDRELCVGSPRAAAFRCSTLRRSTRIEPDFVAVAERFVGVPYLWGGKTSLGIDCSGLVQVALNAAGIACPRDSDMQERALGSPVGVERTRRSHSARRPDLLEGPCRDRARRRRRSCTPTRITWRSQSSRLRKRSGASPQRAAQ